jgi:predicted NUDIX family phosphoesterase
VPAGKTATEKETCDSRAVPSENVAEERVLVVPTELFHALGHFQGFSSDVERYLPGLLESDQVTYRRRSKMEEDPSFKQLIPYMLFRYQRPDGSVEVFQYTRGGGQGEARLHAKRSVGIGGHISSVDAGTGSDTGTGATGSVYREGLERELAEEVVLETGFTEQCVGLINDDQTPVGRVHLGVVHLLDVQEPKVRPNESEILEAGFEPVQRIMAELQQFETWSQIAIRALFG